MELYDLGKVPWEDSQLLYHALARLGREALCLLSPSTPYVCIGYHQDAAHEVDLEFCREHRIPVFRREVGGGAVYLDGAQLFYQVVLQKDNPAAPLNKEAFYRKFLQPVIETYRRIGIAAEYKPVNDVIVGSRKISGTGVGEIGQCLVFVGNLIVDFNYEMMARVLRVPDEKFRDKIHKTLWENLSTIRRELGEEEANGWSESDLNGLLAQEFGKILGPMAPATPDAVVRGKIEQLASRMMTEQWLHQKGRHSEGRTVKIRAGTEVIHKMHKAQGGLLRADFELREGRYEGVSLSGDFFCFPEEAVKDLEKALEGALPDQVESLLRSFYAQKRVETPGVGLEDWLRLLL